jgi:hypothetical protein
VPAGDSGDARRVAYRPGMALLVLAGLGILVVSGVLYTLGRQRGGAVARIHVDDLAVGAGPGVCAVTGEPTANRVQVSSAAGGFQGWWLFLVLFGPVGWIALVVLTAVARRPGRVSGILPMTAEAVQRYDAVVRVSQRAMIVAGAALAAWIGLLVWSGDGFGNPVIIALSGLVVVGAIVAVGAAIAAPFRWIDLELDGSGRWVTITRAHPDYAGALLEHNAAVHARR